MRILQAFIAKSVLLNFPLRFACGQLFADIFGYTVLKELIKAKKQYRPPC